MRNLIFYSENITSDNKSNISVKAIIKDLNKYSFYLII